MYLWPISNGRRFFYLGTAPWSNRDSKSMNSKYQTLTTITKINIAPFIGLLCGVILGIMVSNYPVHELSLSIGFVLAPFLLLIILTCLFFKAWIPVVPRAIVNVYFVYGIFVGYLFIAVFVVNSHFNNMRFLITLPTLPMLTYFICRCIPVKKNIYSGFLLVIILGCMYTIYSSFFEPRGQGMTTGENSSAVILVVGFVFVLWQAQNANSMWQKLGLILIALLMVSGVIATGSRTGYISLIVSVLAMLFISKFSRKMAIVLLCLTIAFMFIRDESYQVKRVMGAIEILMQGESTEPGHKNVRNRLIADKIALEMFLDNPIFGIGIGNSKEFLVKNSHTNVSKSHNAYMWLLSEMGSIGFALYIIFLFAIYRLIRTVKPVSVVSTRLLSGYHALCLVNRAGWLMVGFLALLASAFFWHTFTKEIFWVWVSIIAAELADDAYRCSR